MSRQPTSRSCFVCGRENPVGLKVRWDQDPEAGEIRGTVTVPGHFNGYPGVTHGGIVGALLDETAGRTILMDGGFEDLMVTAKLEVVYRRPTPTGVPLLVGRAAAAADRHAGGGRGRAAPSRRHGDGASTVLLARPPAEIVEGWAAEREHWRVRPEGPRRAGPEGSSSESPVEPPEADAVGPPGQADDP